MVSGGSGAVTQEIEPNKYYKFGECTSLTITLAAEISSIENEYKFEFISGAAPTMLSIPESVSWDGGKAPIIDDQKRYLCAIINNVAIMSRGGVAI